MAAITDELITQFKEFTGCDSDDTARQTLQACDGNLETAVQLHFANDGANDGVADNNAQVNQAVQVVESDDEVEVLDEPNHRQLRPRGNNEPIILDDSADEDENGVRRPIAPVSERLVGQSYRQYYGSRSRQTAPNPIFEQYPDYVSGPTTRSRAAAQNGTASEQRRGLRDLATIFRPPIDLIARLDWDNLLRTANEQNTWILVNIQDPSEFACQVLNRDCWSNDTLKEIIKTKFKFWQVYAESPDGRRVTGYYNLKKFPAIFIVDPRTGENTHTVTKRDVSELIAELTDFCERFPTFADRDADLRAKMTPVLSKPTTSMEFSLDDEDEEMNPGREDSDANQPSTSHHVAGPSGLGEPSEPSEPSKPVGQRLGGDAPAEPGEKSMAEIMRERREKFLSQFERK